ncbi:unnamed protein product [Calypogeia fissa]
MATSRRKNYTVGELKQLCFSVLHISQDPVVGAGQRSQAFWDRVTDHYEKSKPNGCEFRGQKSLEGKWSYIRHDTAKWAGVYQQVLDMQISGTNEDDTMEKTRELYKLNHPKGKSFAYEECWAILKDCPKFAMPPDEVQKRKSVSSTLSKDQSPSAAGLDKENGNPNFSEADENFLVGDTMIQESGDEFKRPMGTKKAKDKLKKAKIEESALKMSAQAQLHLAAVGRDKVKVMQDNSLMQLLSLPCDSIEPELRSFMLEWKMEQAKKLRGRMQGYDVQPSVQPPIDSPRASPETSESRDEFFSLEYIFFP